MNHHIMGGEVLKVSFNIGDLADITIVDKVRLSASFQFKISFISYLLPLLIISLGDFILSIPSLMLPFVPT